MLSIQPVDLTFDDDDWRAPPHSARLYRAASVGSWGVTSMGRGFDWNDNDEEAKPAHNESPRQNTMPPPDSLDPSKCPRPCLNVSTVLHAAIPIPHLTPTTPSSLMPPALAARPFVASSQSWAASSHSSGNSYSVGALRYPPSRSPTSPRPRPRRRSSQQRVSLIAGRVSIAPMEPPSPPPALLPSLHRAASSSSVTSDRASTRAPSPTSENQSYLGGRSISEYDIEGEIGRGAYGLVKRAREILADGLVGPPLVIKQVIKSRILADCWKKHPKHGTIPIEIYVMSAISGTPYVLPSRRPWDPTRYIENDPNIDLDAIDGRWVEGKTVKGHPNICPLLDFFEDSHYYYLVLPSTTPIQLPNEPAPPSDLFDLVENFPQGLPASSVRSYLGQIADALCFLHSQGIVHRDVKDENVVLGADGKCVLIDFGSSGLVRKSGWDTFSGTLDYAGPEILRGERYYGKEQDVWAFGVVGYVLLVGECPFMTAAEAQDGLESPFANAAIALDERCGEGKEKEGEEGDGGGALGDAAAMIRACLEVEVGARPTFEEILKYRFLAGDCK